MPVSRAFLYTSSRVPSKGAPPLQVPSTGFSNYDAAQMLAEANRYHSAARPPDVGQRHVMKIALFTESIPYLRNGLFKRVPTTRPETQ
jgi:hypothetical protein